MAAASLPLCSTVQLTLNSRSPDRLSIDASEPSLDKHSDRPSRLLHCRGKNAASPTFDMVEWYHIDTCAID
jgi:hypothetical protein